VLKRFDAVERGNEIAGVFSLLDSVVRKIKMNGEMLRDLSEL
jgi:hypothetical protein